MLNLKETITVACPPQAAFDYLIQFANIRQWDPSVLSARQVTDGTPRIGTHFRLLLQFGGRPVPMDYRITDMAVPRRLVLQGTGTSFTSIIPSFSFCVSCFIFFSPNSDYYDSKPESAPHAFRFYITYLFESFIQPIHTPQC